MFIFFAIECIFREQYLIFFSIYFADASIRINSSHPKIPSCVEVPEVPESLIITVVTKTSATKTSNPHHRLLTVSKFFVKDILKCKISFACLYVKNKTLIYPLKNGSSYVLYVYGLLRTQYTIDVLKGN